MEKAANAFVKTLKIRKTNGFFADRKKGRPQDESTKVNKRKLTNIFQMIRPKKPNRARRAQRKVVLALRAKNRRRQRQMEQEKKAEAVARPDAGKTRLAQRRAAMRNLGEALVQTRMALKGTGIIGTLQLLSVEDLNRTVQLLAELRGVKQLAPFNEDMAIRERIIFEMLNRYGIVPKKRPAT